ncbi:MAG: phosphate propanoyltransferase [Actinomycetota bacterium]|nr:phosphate propanoyltransferase [Actinomycetota bacterium]
MDTEKLIRDVVISVMEKLQSEPKVPQKAVASQDMGQVKTGNRKIVCGVSVRHVHLCQEDLDTLFGKGYKLTPLRELYNPGFAAKETVTVVGPKLNALQNVRILGPLRDRSQVELAKTDCIILGVDAPVKPSGKLEGTSSAVIVGPKGVVYLKEGVIRANRHIHMCTEDANYFGLKDNDEVDVRVPGPKGLTFNNVQVRVAPDFKTEMHVDTDDANAADIVNGSLVEVVDASCIAPIAPQMANANGTPPEIPDGSYAGEITDINVLKSINSSSANDQAQTIEVPSAPESSNGRKLVITADDLDQYRDTGITLGPNVILTPLARDEAKERGIKIN